MRRPKAAELLTATILLLAVTVCAVSGYVIGFSKHAQNVKIVLQPAQNYNVGWYYVNDDGKNVYIPSLPAKVPLDNDGKARIYHNYVSKERKAICFLTHHQNGRLLQDGNVLYHYKMTGNPDWIKSFRALYHVVTIKPTDSCVLCLEMDALVKGREGEFNEVYMGDKASVMYRLMRNNVSKIYLGAMLCVFGIIALLLGVSTMTRLDNGKSDFTIIYLGLTDLALGLWQLEESRILQFFIGSQALHWSFEYMLQYIIICTSLMFIRSLTSSKMTGVTNVFTGIILYFAGLQLLLQITGVIQITSSSVLLYVIFLAICFYIGYLMLFTVKFYNSFLKILFTSSMGTSIIMLAVVMILRSSQSKSKTDFWMTIALIFMFMSLTVVVYQKTIEKFEKLKEARLYEKLALVDFNTGVSSKTAWFYLVEKFDYQEHLGTIYCLIMFDMNNLKKLNDTLGHLVGDKVINAFCDCMRETFESKGEIYRIGGDEFICLLENTDEDDVRKLLAEFDRRVASQKETDHKFTVAYGWSMFKPHSREDFVQAQQRADSLMYEMKKRMKSAAAMENPDSGAVV
ncbi:MAG: GGDEF domain-containing protein [Treponema sp.]|nr:GGDEF domain-containing protein [Treponema sp.]